MFDAAGHYSLEICASGRPRFVANDRLRGTPDEYRAAASGCTVHWGHYVLNENDGTIVFRIEHALLPNWEGTEQTRPFKMANGYLSYHVPRPATEAENAVVVWKRAPHNWPAVERRGRASLHGAHGRHRQQQGMPSSDASLARPPERWRTAMGVTLSISSSRGEIAPHHSQLSKLT
jgi:hypothetical protein